MLSDSVLAIPGLLLVLLVAALAPGALWALYAGLSAALWVEYFRVSRAVARPVLAGDAVQASRLLGFGRGYVLRRHLLPALAPTLGTLLAFTTSQAVLALAALGFVGVGMQPPTPELGLMMTEAMPYYEEAPWLIAAPTALLVWLVAAMMLLNPDRETGLGIQVGGKRLLRDIGFSLRPGEALTLVGESGAGKSLLAQAIMGNLPPALQATGQITLDGITTRAQDAAARRALWGRKLALLPQ
eukprot:gene6883-8559_t